MLNQAGMILLSELPRLPQALRLFADYDFSVPRLLIPDMLDSRYEWKPGTGQRVLNILTDCGLLIGRRMLRLAPQYRWKPSDLAQQWETMRKTEQREALINASASTRG